MLVTAPAMRADAYFCKVTRIDGAGRVWFKNEEGDVTFGTFPRHMRYEPKKPWLERARWVYSASAG